MVIKPNIVRLLYGTVAVATVATTGTLWYNRTGPALVKTIDYVELFQGTLERVMATEYDSSRTNVPVPGIYTNLIAEWTPDSHTWTYYDGTNAVATNYWKLSGYTHQTVVTNDFANRTYKSILPMNSISGRTRMHPLIGSLGRNKYIWNGYSNLVVSGSVRYNGTYTIQTAGTVPAKYSSETTPVTYFWQSGTNWIVDRGPSFNCILGCEYDLTTEAYLDFETLEWIDPSTNLLYTQDEDAALNGPWYSYNDVATAVTVVGSNFAPELLRDAVCHWYIDKGMHETADSRHDPRYDYRGVGVLDVHVSQLDLIDLLFDDGELPYVGDRFGDPVSCYVSTNIVASAITNYSQIADYVLNITTVTNFANVPIDEWAQSYFFRFDISTLSNPLTTNNFTDVARYLHELQWTRAGNSLRWCNPGSKNGSVSTNQYIGYALNAPTWAAAKAIAATNFALREIVSDGGLPKTTTEGWCGGLSNYTAVIRACQMELTYQGSCTDIVKDVCFWIEGGLSSYGEDNEILVYDDFGTGISSNNYTQIAVQLNSTNRYPYIAIGSTNFSWCAEPPYIPFDTSSRKRGWEAKEAEIIQKWHFNYLTNAIP